MKFQADIPEWISRTITLTIVGLLLFNISFGQTQLELEKQRKRLIQEIKQTAHRLDKTKKDKATTLEGFLALQSQIKKRQQLIETLLTELELLETNLSKTHDVIDGLNTDISRLQEEYAKMARFAYRQKISNNTLFFIFSSTSINDAVKRWHYLKQYDKYRQKQAILIGQTQKKLAKKLEDLELEKEEKQALLATHESQQVVLNKDLKTKNKTLKKLKSSEARLINDLANRQEAHAALNRSIEEVIRQAIAAKKKAARTPQALANTQRNGALAEHVKLSGTFQLNKGKLPWPVNSGRISRRFGKQAHATLKTITITNNGIDISTQRNAEVRAVFQGKVVGMQFIPGYKNMIILQHGNYYTVYSNLEEVYVKRNDAIRAGQAIGKVDSKKAEVHFEVWKEKKRLNPANWIRQ